MDNDPPDTILERLDLEPNRNQIGLLKMRRTLWAALIMITTATTIILYRLKR
jgi:hypothetical protein